MAEYTQCPTEAVEWGDGEARCGKCGVWFNTYAGFIQSHTTCGHAIFGVCGSPGGIIGGTRGRPERRSAATEGGASGG